MKKINNLTTIIKKYKPNKCEFLIVLSILCQGYLAAHEKIDLPEGLSISKDEKVNTRKRNWWEPALGNNFEGLELNKKLEAVDEDNHNAKKVIIDFRNIISKDDNEYFDNGRLIEDDSNIRAFTNLVMGAYGQIKKILGPTK